MGADVNGHALLNVFSVTSLLHVKAESDGQSEPPKCMEPWHVPLSRLVLCSAMERTLALKSAVGSNLNAASH